MKVYSETTRQSKEVAFEFKHIYLHFCVFDQCCGDDAMRERWISAFGWFRPWWSRRDKEVGFEYCGKLYTLTINY